VSPQKGGTFFAFFEAKVSFLETRTEIP